MSVDKFVNEAVTIPMMKDILYFVKYTKSRGIASRSNIREYILPKLEFIYQNADHTIGSSWNIDMALDILIDTGILAYMPKYDLLLSYERIKQVLLDD